MAKYRVFATLGAGAGPEVVEADSPEEAVAISDVGYGASLCHQCSGEVDLGEPFDWHVEEVDGDGVWDFSDFPQIPESRVRAVLKEHVAVALQAQSDNERAGDDARALICEYQVRVLCSVAAVLGIDLRPFPDVSEGAT